MVSERGLLPAEDTGYQGCHVWFEMGVLLDDPDGEWSPWELVRPFTLDCIEPKDHEGPHRLEVCYLDD